MENGQTNAYGMRDLEKLGTLFVPPQVAVYEGMIIGESSTDKDWNVNPCKTKKLTNIRTHAADEAIRLNPPKVFNIEDAISYIRGNLSFNRFYNVLREIDIFCFLKRIYFFLIRSKMVSDW